MVASPASHVSEPSSTGPSTASISSDIYPFQGQFVEVGGHRYHYLDEGEGEPVVMVHGNPSWSIYYRQLVLALRGKHRCLVPDHIGCGFSDKPVDADYEYSIRQRIEDLESFLEQVGANKNITLIVHDWGGMIGMGWAARNPGAVKRIVILNTAAFHLPKSKALPAALWLCRDTKLGAFMVRRFNAFSYFATWVACRKASMSAALREAYCAPYNSWDNRIATLRFVQDIPLKPGDRGYELITEVQDALSQFKEIPKMICWGMKDFVFDHHFLDTWLEHWPEAEVHRFEDCGHYILEDAQEEILELVQSFIEANP